MKKIITGILLLVSSTAMAQSSEQLLGCWEMKSRAGEHIQLMRDGTFTFHDYNSKKGDWDNLTGMWEYMNNKLTLLYDDRTKQSFTVQKKGTVLVLTKAGGFKMTKADPSECGM